MKKYIIKKKELEKQKKLEEKEARKKARAKKVKALAEKHCMNPNAVNEIIDLAQEGVEIDKKVIDDA